MSSKNAVDRLAEFGVDLDALVSDYREMIGAGVSDRYAGAFITSEVTHQTASFIVSSEEIDDPRAALSEALELDKQVLDAVLERVGK